MHAEQRGLSGEVLRVFDLWPYKRKGGKRGLSGQTAPENVSAHLLAGKNGGGRYLNSGWFPNLGSPETFGQRHLFHPGPGRGLASRFRPSIIKEIRLGAWLWAVALCKVIPALDRHIEICTDFASLR